jgi:hypothetical protein
MAEILNFPLKLFKIKVGSGWVNISGDQWFLSDDPLNATYLNGRDLGKARALLEENGVLIYEIIKL